jgi:DDE superfamily endonuclease
MGRQEARLDRGDMAKHEDWGTIALPLQAQLYIRKADLPKLPPECPREFARMNSEGGRMRRRGDFSSFLLLNSSLRSIKPWVENDFEQLWVVVDGGYAKKTFLQGAKQAGFTVVSRLRKDAALRSLPLPKPAGQRGPQATYGKERISRHPAQRSKCRMQSEYGGRGLSLSLSFTLHSALCILHWMTAGSRSSAPTRR